MSVGGTGDYAAFMRSMECHVLSACADVYTSGAFAHWMLLVAQIPAILSIVLVFLNTYLPLRDVYYLVAVSGGLIVNGALNAVLRSALAGPYTAPGGTRCATNKENPDFGIMQLSFLFTLITTFPQLWEVHAARARYASVAFVLWAVVFARIFVGYTAPTYAWLALALGALVGVAWQALMYWLFHWRAFREWRALARAIETFGYTLEWTGHPHAGEPPPSPAGLAHAMCS